MAQPALAERLYTPEELEALPDAVSYELIDGVLTERTMSNEAGRTTTRITGILWSFVEEHDLGELYSPEVGLRLWPDRPLNFRKPDIAFISRARASDDALAGGFLTVAPDLVVEVLSKHDNATATFRKIADYLSGGVRLIWIADIPTRAVQVVRADKSGHWFDTEDTITGEDVLPGFSHRVADLFPAMPPVPIRADPAN